MKKVQPFTSQRVVVPALPAIRLRGSVFVWSAVMAVSWLAVAVLLFIPSVWLVPSYLASALPRLYGVVVRWLPASVVSPVVHGLPRALPAIAYVIAMTAVWLSYVAAVRSISRMRDNSERAARRIFAFIMVSGFLIGLMAVFWMGLFTTDPFLYAAQGKMQLLHGLNPIIKAPAAMGYDPLFRLTPWKDIISAYGPIWLGFTWLAALVGEKLGGSFLVYVLEYRIVNLFLMSLATWLVWLIGGRLDWTAPRRAVSTALFAWCPLMILELVGNTHNDMFMVVFLLAAIWLHLRGAWPWAVAALTAAGMVKITGFFLLPAYIVLLARTSGYYIEAGRRVAASIAIAIGVTFITYIPYADPGAFNAFLSNPMKGFVTNSLAMAFRESLIDIQQWLRGIVTPLDQSRRQALENVRMLAWWGPFALWGLIAIFFTFQARDFKSLLRSWAWILITYMVVGAVWFQPWYATWLVTVLVLLPPARLRKAGLLLAYGCTIGYSVIPHIPPDIVPRFFPYYGPAVIFLPMLLYCAGVGVLAWRKRRREWREQSTVPA